MNNLVEKNKFGFYNLKEKPRPEELKEYYAQKYYQKNEGAYEQSYDPEELRYLNNKIEQKYHLFKEIAIKNNHTRLLEIGCGEGHCLSFFYKKGWEVLGLDFSDYGLLNHNPDQKKNLLKGDIYENIQALLRQNKKYDVIWIDNVLEHVIDPLQLLIDCHKLSSKEGVLVIEVPNDFSVIQQELRNKDIVKNDFWVAIPDHLSYFNKEGLCNICKESGWYSHRIVADFPIDFNLFNPNADYINQKQKGKGAYLQRIALENIMHQISVEKTNLLYESLANLGMGRQIISVFIKEKETI